MAKTTFLSLAMIAGSIVATGAEAATNGQIGVADIGLQSPQLGDGYNRITAAVAGRCVQYGTNAVRRVPGLGVRQVNVSEVSSSESLRSALQLSAAATFGFGLYQGSASSSLYQSLQQSTYTHYLLVSEDIDAGSVSIQTDLVKPSPLGRDAISHPAAFVARCGTDVVSGENYGATLTLIWQFEATTESSEQNIAANLSGAGPWGSASFSTALSRIENDQHTNTKFYMESPGYLGKIPDYNDYEALKRFVIDYPTTIQCASQSGGPPVQCQRPLSQGVQSYASLFAHVSTSYADDAMKMDDLADKYEKAIQRYNGLLFVRQNAQLFSGFATITDVDVASANQLVAQIREKARQCGFNAVACDPSSIVVPDVPALPSRIMWKTINAQDDSWQSIDDIPTGKTMVLEVKGSFSRHMGDNNWARAEDGNVEYRALGADGKPFQADTFHGPTVQIRGPARVQMRVIDNEAPPGYTDNSPTVNCEDDRTVCAALW